MSRLPSAEQPEPKSEVFDIRELRAASTTSAVSSITIVELPPPTPNAGVPELYAALTIAAPPVAKVRSQVAMSSWDSGIDGCSTHWKTSAGAPSRTMTSRMIRTVSFVVALVRGWPQKITASRALIA